MADKKLRLAVLMAGACGGCDMAIVDISETLVDVLPSLEVVFWAPTVADVKYKDLEAMPDKSVDVGLISGMIRLDEHEHMCKVMRAKCNVIVAYGACAAMGGIPGMANMHTKEEIFQTAYFDTFSTDNPDGVTPQPSYLLDGKYDLTLPTFYPYVRPIQSVIDVDFFLGGCPPHHSVVLNALVAILKGELPPKGSWITNGKAVCDICVRNPRNTDEKRETIKEVRRTIDGDPDENKCLLQQGYMCLGPITQGDCGALCPKVNIPCAGCGGPIPGVKDFGLRAVSAIASLMDNEDLVNQIPSPVKLFYRYSLPSSMMGKKVKKV